VPVVGTLTVDLVANTATFTADLGKAGNSLDDLGKKAKQAGDTMDYSMMEARGGIALMSEELGVHIPRHLQTLIAEIPAVGEAFATMLPIVGVVAAIAIIAKLIEKNEEAKEKLAAGWAKFGETSASVLSGLDDKLLQVGMRADELAGNHLAAMRKELVLIDHATLHELIAEFGKLSSEADTMFADLKTHWYEAHVGSDGAKHALDEFRKKYDELIYAGKGKDASDLLKGTLDSAKASLKTMETAGFVAKGLGEVSKEGLESQRALVDTLNTQLIVEQKLHDVGEGEKKNVQTEQGQKDFSVQEKARAAYAKSIKELNGEIDKSDEATAKHFQDMLDNEMKAEVKAADANAKTAQESNRTAQQSADEQTAFAIKAAQEQYKAEEENSKHMVAMHRETAAQAAEQDATAAKAETAAEVKALQDRLATLDAYGKDKEKKEQEINDKIREITQQGADKVKQIQDQSQVQQLQSLTQAENKMGEIMASTAAKSILENKNMGAAFAKVGAQMLEHMMTNLMEAETVEGQEKLIHAKGAAVKSFDWASNWGGPLAGAVAAAAAFAGVMAFAGGGEVPGMGTGDTVPAMLTPGETVVTKSLTDQVRNSRGGNGHTVNYAPTIHAVDSDGVQDMLEKHEAVFTAHVMSTLRKNHVR
jgi:hypothetical protein